jgi:hypothetical protein
LPPLLAGEVLELPLLLYILELAPNVPVLEEREEDEPLFIIWPDRES